MKQQTLYKYTFNDGTVYTSVLPKDIFIDRLARLDTLRVLTECYLGEASYGDSICRKAINAYNKYDNFTGIIRLSFGEKDWLAYLLESDMLDDNERDIIEFYSGTHW